MERAEQMGQFTQEEKEALRGLEQLQSLLGEFYKGHINKDGLWQNLKDMPHSILLDAQRNMIDSMRIGSSPEELQLRKDGIVAIESLKKKKNTSAIEGMLKSIEMLQRDYRQKKEHAIEELRAAMQENPQLRLRPVKMPDGRTVLQAARSIDEAVQAKLAEFLADHENRYEAMFARAVQRLRDELK
jgi:arsenate reductase-like glutaredoxin family protein